MLIRRTQWSGLNSGVIFFSKNENVMFQNTKHDSSIDLKVVGLKEIQTKGSLKGVEGNSIESNCIRC